MSVEQGEDNLLRLGVDVVRGNVGVDTDIDPDRTSHGAPLPRELGDGFTQELDIQLEAEGGEVTVLLGSEELSGPADLEVALAMANPRRAPCGRPASRDRPALLDRAVYGDP